VLNTDTDPHAKALKGCSTHGTAMSRTVGRAVTLSLLMLTSIILAFVGGVEGRTISSDERWSGDFVLSEDITVAVGSTLTIEAGTNVTVTGDHSISVAGNMVVEGTAGNSAVIWSNYTPVLQGGFTGLWEGVTVEAGGSLIANHLVLRNARAAFDINGTATLSSVTAEDSYMGIRNRGTVAATDFSCARIDFTCIEVKQTGSATVNGVTSDDSAISIENNGYLDLDSLSVSEGSIGLILNDGSTGSADGLDISETSTAIISRGATSVRVDSVTVDGVGLLFDGVSSDGAHLSNITGEVELVAIGSDLVDVTLSDLTLNGTGANGWSLTLLTAGQFTLADSTLSGFSQGMRLSGVGVQTFDGVNLATSGTLFDATGSGRLDVTDSQFSTGEEFGHVSSLDSFWTDSSITGDESSTGLELIDGKHVFTSTTLSRSYLGNDATSFGLAVTWGEVESHGLTLEGWSDGLLCRSDCAISGTSLTSQLGGLLSGSGILIDGGSVALEALTTGNSFNGIHLVEGDLHLDSWTASGHQDATIQIDADQTAVVRNLPAMSSNGLWDADGEGTLYFGGTNGRVDVNTSYEFTESTVSVTDLSQNALPGVYVEAHGFNAISDSQGEVTLPLINAGSEVTANDGTYGATTTLSPPGGEVQLPLIPTSGPWVVPIGVTARLYGANFTTAAGFDVTISTAAKVVLIDAHLSVPGGAIVIEGTGTLEGDGGSTDAVVYGNTSHSLKGSGAGLTVGNDVHTSCQLEALSWSGVNVEGDFHLEQTCSLSIYDGSIDGTIHPSMGGYLALKNAALVRVLDWGEPVEGATVTVQGRQVVTNSEGVAFHTATYRNVTEIFDDSTGVLAVYVLKDGHSQVKSWGPSSPATFDFMMSTIDGGSTFGWLRLEKTFSPYYLESDLIVTSGTTMTLLEFVSLNVKSDAGIRVDGVLESTRATITGADWDGISTTEGAVVNLDYGHYIGAPLSVGPAAAAVTLTEMVVDGASLMVSGSGSLTVEGGLLHQTDNCIFSNGGSITITGTQIQSCSQNAALLTQAAVSIDGVTLGAGNEKGLYLRGGSGTVTNLDATAHDGEKAAVHLEMVDGGLTFEGLNITAGTGAAALAVEWSEQAVIRNSDIHGSPGISLTQSTGTLSGLNFHGDGGGVALEITGVRADRTTVSDSVVSNYDTSVILTGDEGDVENQPPLFTNNQFDSTIAFATHGFGFESRGDSLSGEITLGGEKSYIAEIWDPISFDSSAISIIGQASLVIGSTWTVQVLGDAGIPIIGAWLEVTVESFGGSVPEQVISTSSGDGGASIPLIYQTWSETGQSSSTTALWSATAMGYVAGSGAFSIGESTSRFYSAELNRNQDPVVSIVEPNGAITVQQGEPVNFSAVAQDPDCLDDDCTEEGEELSFSWHLREQGENSPGPQIFTGESGSLDSIGSVGVHIVTVVVSDPWGGSSFDALTITVILDDADGDFIDTCMINGLNAWYDMEEDRKCGPDVYDEDDDNDRIDDVRDAFPFDACAHSDNDLDGLPNSLLPNCETDLIEDDDDDNDGVPDSEDADPLDATIGAPASGSSDSGFFTPGVIIPILILLVVVAAIFLRGTDRLSEKP
jgi:hypothetical protein